MFNLIKADLYKMRKTKSIKILFLLCCISATLMSVISYQLANVNLSHDIIGIGSFFTDFQMISLVSVIFISLFICNDFDNKTIHDSISTGYSRSSIIICKTITYFISILIFLLPYVIAAIVGMCSNYSFETFLPSVFQNIMKNENGTAFDFNIFLKIIAIWFTMAIVYASQISISIFLAFSIRKSVIVISLGYIFNAAIAQIINIDAASDFFSKTPFGVDYSKLTLNADSSVFFNFIGISLVFLVIMMLLSYLFFRKAEIK